MFGSQLLIAFPKRLIADATGLLAGHGLHHAFGMFVDGCAAIATVLRASRHRSPSATENRCRIAYPLLNR